MLHTAGNLYAPQPKNKKTVGDRAQVYLELNFSVYVVGKRISGALRPPDGPKSVPFRPTAPPLNKIAKIPLECTVF